MQLPNVSALQGGNYVNTPQISLGGFYAANDGGEGTFVSGLTPTAATMTGTARFHSSLNVLVSLSADPTVVKWGLGMRITDSLGAIPANTYITSVSSTTITLSQSTTSGPSNDTFTVSCVNGGTIIADSAGNCFYRTNTNGDLMQFGITTSSPYDPLAFPTTAQDASGIITSATSLLPFYGITVVHSRQRSFYIANSITLLGPAILTCDIQPAGPYSDGIYTNKPGSIMEAHGATVQGIDNQDGSNINGCNIFPQFLANPSVVSAFGGYAFTAPPLVYNDLDAIRGNMIKAGDTAVTLVASKGSKPTNLGIYGFDTCVRFQQADHLNAVRMWGDCNFGLYGALGGGQSDNDTTDFEPFIAKVANGFNTRCNPLTTGSGTAGACNEEGWDIASIARSTVTNSFGEHVCRVTLQSALFQGNPTNGWPVSDIHTSNTYPNGDPITYPVWIANLGPTNPVAQPNALGCLGTGPFAVSVVSPGVIDLLGSAYGTGADAIPLVVTWVSGSDTIRVVSGDVNNLQVAEIVAGTGIPVGATITNICLRCHGPDPYDGYIAEFKISAPTTSSTGADTSITADGGTFTHGDTCNLAGAGGCFFLNASQRTFGGLSIAGVGVSNLPWSNQHHWSSCYTANGVPGFRSHNPFCYGHHYSYVMQDANNFVFTQQHNDDNGELDDRSSINMAVGGTTANGQTVTNGLTKGGVGLVTDLFNLSESSSHNTTTSSAVGSGIGITISTAASMATWPTDRGTGTAGGKFTVTICAALNGDADCSNQSPETITAELVDNTHLTLLARGTNNTIPQTFSSGAPIFYTVISSNAGAWAGYADMGADATDNYLNTVELVHGGMHLTNIKSKGTARGIYITTNAAQFVATGVTAPTTTMYYEDANAASIPRGCGNLFTTTQTWECTPPGGYAGPFTPTGASNSTTLPNFGDRALSLLDFTGAVPDWTTNSTLALIAAETAALAQGVHVIRLDCNTVGCGYVFSTHTVPDGITLYCPGPKAIESPTNDYRNFPNAIILTGTAGLKFSGHSGEVGCNILQTTLANSSPPATEQDSYTRLAAFTGTGVTCLGTCTIKDSMILGFATDLTLGKGVRSSFVSDLQLDGQQFVNIASQAPGGVLNLSNISAAPFATRNNAAALTTIPATSIGTNGSGALRVTYPSCATGNCPLTGYQAWVRAPNGVQSSQGGWTLSPVTATTADLVGSTDVFIAGYASTGAVVTAGSTKIVLSSTTNTKQMEPTQNVTGATCIPAGAQIAMVQRNYGIIYLDAAHPATCTVTETVTITDDSTGIFQVNSATLNAGGTLYQSGDELTLVGGTYTVPATPTPATIIVDTVDVNGVILTFHIGDSGSYSVLPGPTGVATTGGAGTGATFDISSAGQLVLDSNVRTGPGLNIGSVNSVNIDGVNMLGAYTGVSFGFQASGVKMTNVKFNDENYLQDPTHVGIQFANSTFSNSITNCGIYYFGYGLLSQTKFTNASASPNEVSHCHLGGLNGASGLQGVIFSLESATPGTATRQGFILDHNFAKGATVGFISDDLTQSVQINGNQFPQTTLYGQSEATASNVSGAGNNFSIDSMPIFALAPSGSGPRIAPAGVSDLYLTNANCASLVSAGSAGGTLTVHLPPLPVLSCEITLRPTTNTIIIDANGKSIRTLNAAAVTSAVTLSGASGSPQIIIAWDNNTWEVRAGAPDTLSMTFQNGQTLAHGQVYMSCTTCSGGTAVLQVYPANGAGGLTIAGILQRVPATGLFLPNAAFSGFTSQRVFIYALEQNAAITSIVNSGGKAGLTLGSVAGFQNGDAIYCSNADGTPLVNNSLGDANTTVSGSVVTLTDINFVANNTTGSCWWLGLIPVTNAHGTLNGVEVRAGTTTQTLVGEVGVDASHNLNDTLIARDVVSYFNRQPKKMLVACGAGVTTGNGTSGTAYKTPTTVCEGQFVSFGPQATPGALPAPAVSWRVNSAVANSFLAGTQGTSACFGTSALAGNATCTPETEEAFAAQAVAADAQSANVAGDSIALTEGINFMDLAGFCTGTAPTCTYTSGHTSIEAIPWQ